MAPERRAGAMRSELWSSGESDPTAQEVQDRRPSAIRFRSRPVAHDARRVRDRVDGLRRAIGVRVARCAAQSGRGSRASASHTSSHDLASEASPSVVVKPFGRLSGRNVTVLLTASDRSWPLG
jgi:hypothetical protein